MLNSITRELVPSTKQLPDKSANSRDLSAITTSKDHSAQQPKSQTVDTNSQKTKSESALNVSKQLESNKALESNEEDTADKTDNFDFINITPVLSYSPKQTKETVEAKQYESQKKYKERTNHRTRRHYSVQAGDNLEKIAEYFYGDSTIAVVIYHYNQNKIPLFIYKGTEYSLLELDSILSLPSDKQIENFRKNSLALQYQNKSFGRIPFTAEDEIAFWQAGKAVFQMAKQESPLSQHASPSIKKLELLNNYMRIVEFAHAGADKESCVSLEILRGSQYHAVLQYQLQPHDFQILTFNKSGKLSKKLSKSLAFQQSHQMAWTDMRQNWQKILDNFARG